MGSTGTAAIRAAGCKSPHARTMASRLLRDPEIAEAIEQRQKELIAEVGFRQLQVYQQLAAIAKCDPRKLVDAEGEPIPLHKLDAETAAAIASVEVENISINGETGKRYKYRFWDKPKANDRAGIYLKMWDAPGAKVTLQQNNDNRSVTNVIATSPEAVSGAIRLLEQARSIGASAPAALSHSDGSLLPVAVRDESAGHRAPVDAGEDKGSSE